jgi:hypothetical protein
VGEIAKPLRRAGCPPVAGFTVNTAAWVFADAAVIVALVGVKTVVVETGNVALV